ncbi:MAG: DUF4159 domain-containing protein [Myxococcales bacterium]|nr:DUF4159 domain-containing protein [Myxococcales bacterium]
MSLDRRRFLCTTGLGLLAASSARAMGLDGKVGIGLLAHGPGHAARPSAVEQLMWEVSKRTSIDVRETPETLDPKHPDLFRFPLLVWLGNGDCPPLSQEARARLQRYLRAGGTLFIDDASPEGDDAFDAAVRREVGALWPDAPLARLDADHTLYRTFFLIERPQGRVSRLPYLEGVSFDDRSPIVYGRNDLFGAFGRDGVGTWRLPVVPGGRTQREMAFRLGINLVMYATCLNYKRDQVHTTAILRRRRWRVESPRDTR